MLDAHILEPNRRLVDLLKRLSGSVFDDEVELPEDETTMVRRARYIFAPLLHKLFATIAKHWRCRCHHRVGLFLCTH